MNMNLRNFTICLTLVSMIACTAKKEASEESEDAMTEEAVAPEAASGVFFVDLKDGDVVKSPVVVNMGVSGMEIEPAGPVNEGKGHHHIIIDGSFVENGVTVPADATHIHFGKGQTSDTLELAPGPHTITLQFANGLHASYGEDWSKTISVTVE
jgi:hypothetical protein